MKKITIGRNADNDIVIPEQSVSGNHADLILNDDGSILYIDHSTNGTMINGNHLLKGERHLTRNDVVVFPGGMKLDWNTIPVIEVKPAPAPAPAPGRKEALAATCMDAASVVCDIPDTQSDPVPSPAPAPSPVTQVVSQPVPAPQPAPAPMPQQAPVQQPYQPYQQPMQPQVNPYEQGDISFVGVLTNFWKNYFNFSGRARRKEYWLMCVWNMIFSITGIGLLVVLAECIGLFTLTARRLHDAGKSAWNLLWGLIPFVGQIIILVFLCQDSECRTNKWGRSPKYINS